MKTVVPGHGALGTVATLRAQSAFLDDLWTQVSSGKNSMRRTWWTWRSFKASGRLVRTGEVSCRRAAEAIADLTELDLHRHAHLDLVGRAWTLRDHISAYDAVYVALAEAIDAPIVTCDRPLAKASGHRARIELID